MNDKTAAKQMRREYGENLCESCSDCCNRQRMNRNDAKMICIAYGGELSWSGTETACGLFNIPFRGLRPKRIPFAEILNRGRNMKSPATDAEDQIRLSLT